MQDFDAAEDRLERLAGHGDRALARRLRHRPFVPGVAEPPAHPRPQDPGHLRGAAVHGAPLPGHRDSARSSWPTTSACASSPRRWRPRSSATSWPRAACDLFQGFLFHAAHARGGAAARPGRRGGRAFHKEPSLTTSFAKSRMKILLLEGVHDRAVENFKRHGYTAIERHKKALAGDGARETPSRDAHFVGIRSRTQLTADVIAAAPAAHGHRGLLHRHQPDRPRRRARCAASPSSTRPSPTRARWPSWCWPRSSCCCAASRPRTRCCTAGCGPSPPTTRARCAARRWASSATATSAPSSSVLAEALGMHVLFYDVVTKLPLGNARTMPSLDELLAVRGRGHPARAGDRRHARA